MTYKTFRLPLAALIGALWSATLGFGFSVSLAFSTGEGFYPIWWALLITGGLTALVLTRRNQLGGGYASLIGSSVFAFVLLILTGFMPFGISLAEAPLANILGLSLFAVLLGISLKIMVLPISHERVDRHDVEYSLIAFMKGFGYIFFTAIVLIPFFVMVMTSLKSQQSLMMNPLDFSIELSRGWDLFRSYEELFSNFNFGEYLLNSALVSVATVLITLLFSAPGAYAVARLKFSGRDAMSRGILLIYMVPMIVLALPIYIAFSMLELRNSLVGLLLIYPVTTIPVALYMLQGYFRGLPVEVEEAGLMDGLSRIQVIIKITLPLALPALASVALYVFMIAWNEFLLAFMLLDDPSIFTLTRGVAMLNSSEIPRQHLMAGAVISTLPIMMIFLVLERYMTKGLTAGSVKG